MFRSINVSDLYFIDISDLFIECSDLYFIDISDLYLLNVKVYMILQICLC
jgi:hypothetical protein